MKAGFVFDLDGTLVDSLPGIAQALNAALAARGEPTHTEQAIRTMVGKGAKELCRAALTAASNDSLDDRIHDLLDGFMVEYPHTWQQGTIPYPGIENLLDQLQGLNIPLAVLSNKPDIVTRPLVREIFPHIKFDMVMGFSDRFPRKPDPASLLYITESRKAIPKDITMIGDSKHDGLTAQQAGTNLILVSWGYSNIADLEPFNVPICNTTEQLFYQLVQK